VRAHLVRRRYFNAQPGTGKAFTVVECLTAPGGGPATSTPARRIGMSSIWTFEIHIGDEVHAIGPGGLLFGPRARRTTSVTPRRPREPDPLTFTPGGPRDFFRRVRSASNQRRPRATNRWRRNACMMAAAPEVRYRARRCRGLAVSYKLKMLFPQILDVVSPVKTNGHHQKSSSPGRKDLKLFASLAGQHNLLGQKSRISPCLP